MILTAVNIRTRIMLSKLLIKRDKYPEYSREIGLADNSCFMSKANLEEKEVDKC